MIRQDRLAILLALYDRTVSEVAHACGMSTANASRLINGRRMCRPDLLAALETAIVMGAPPSPQARTESEANAAQQAEVAA